MARSLFSRGTKVSVRKNMEYIRNSDDIVKDSRARANNADYKRAVREDNRMRRQLGRSKDSDDISAQLGRITSLRDQLGQRDFDRNGKLTNNSPFVRMNRAFRIADRMQQGGGAGKGATAG